MSANHLKSLQTLARVDPGDYLPGDQRPVFFLDYDGTLTPIVANPEQAYLSESMRDVVRDIARDLPVAIVSGRERRDVQQLVGLEEVYYAGSHGYDIAGPEGTALELAEAGALIPKLQMLYNQLKEELTAFEGTHLELKRYSLAIHYRNMKPEHTAALQARVTDRLAQFSGLSLNGGKKVLEVQPAVRWDKGQAMLWLMRQLGASERPRFPIFIGDDLTDEYAFEKLPASGFGILVGEVDRPTAAQYYLSDVAEVETFLRAVHAYYMA
jgi:trehalose-phosphatase